MKITAIIDDQMIQEAMEYSNTSTITAALKIALKEYISIQKLKLLSRQIKSEPLRFHHSSNKIRSTNRK